MSEAPAAAHGGGDGAGGGRLLSLDVFRGVTIAGMILVNNPGDWSHVYSPLRHAEWHGWTPTDLVFPFFLFIVGVSITIALSRGTNARGVRRGPYLKIVRRAAIIFALGLFLNGFPFFDLPALRMPGVLQRIAVCYLCAAVIFLETGWRTQAAAAAALLLGYWALLSGSSAPGFAAGDLSKEGSLASFVDRLLLAGHIYKREYDPEGLLSTLPAVATTLAGVLTGHLLRSRRGDYEKVSALFVAGAGCVVAGWAWNYWFPVNKALWTSSYVMLTAGMALQLLAACYWLIDLKGYRRWATPFFIFGTNAIAAYVVSVLLGRLMSLWKITHADGVPVSLRSWVYERCFASWAPPVNASLLWAASYVLLMLLLMWLLYRRRVFIRI